MLLRLTAATPLSCGGLLLACSDDEPPADAEAVDALADEDEARCGAAAYIESGHFEESLFSKAPDPEVNARIDSTIAQAVARC